MACLIIASDLAFSRVVTLSCRQRVSKLHILVAMLETLSAFSPLALLKLADIVADLICKIYRRQVSRLDLNSSIIEQCSLYRTRVTVGIFVRLLCPSVQLMH